MGSFCVVVGSLFIDALSRIGHRDEPGSVQAFGTKTTVERLDEPIICWLSGPRKVELDLIQISLLPAHQTQTSELGTADNPNASWLAADPRQSIRFVDRLIRPEVCPR